MKAEVYIYGLADKSNGAIRYVGQTCNVKARYFGLTSEGKMKPGIGMAILRIATPRNALRMEARLIRAFKLMGRCEWNKNTGTSGIARKIPKKRKRPTVKPLTRNQMTIHFRDLQRRSAAARWGKFDSGQRKAAMAALARARWDKRKGKI